jgi:hypothetical protein
MNLLRADWTGSVGRTTGARSKGKSIIKAKIEGKAPPNELQTRSLRAFESLNRLSAAIARDAWQYTGLSDRSMLRHNAVARWLKPVVSNHEFDLDGISRAMPPTGNIRIDAAVYDSTDDTIAVHISIDHRSVGGAPKEVVLSVSDDIGRTTPIITIPYQSGNYIFQKNEKMSGQMQAIGWVAVQYGKKRTPSDGLTRRVTMLNYSFDEQPMGILWLNGKPLYQRSWDIGNMPAGSDVYPQGLDGVAEDIVSGEVTFLQNNYKLFGLDPWYAGSSHPPLTVRKNVNGKWAIVAGVVATNVKITLRYTKIADADQRRD